MDELYHDQWARAVVEGRSFIEGPYFRAPLYPYFLAAVYAVFGHGYVVPQVAQCLIGSASCGLVFLIGRQAFGRTVGAVAGFAAASYWMLIYFDNELLLPVLDVFFDLLLIGQLLPAARTPGLWTDLMAGLFLGLSAIVRPNALLFVPAVLTWVAVSDRAEWKRRLSHAACFWAGCALPILPVTSRNYLRGGDRVLIASQGGVNFYIGNNPRSDGMTAIVPDTPGD